MILDYNVKGKVQVDMKYYIKKMVENYPRHVKPSKTPWNDSLFIPNENSPALDNEENQIFHSTIVQGMFLAKRGRPDVEPAFSYFSTRVKGATENDRSKLEKVLGFLLSMIDDILVLEADN